MRPRGRLLAPHMSQAVTVRTAEPLLLLSTTCSSNDSPCRPAVCGAAGARGPSVTREVDVRVRVPKASIARQNQLTKAGW